MEEDKCVEYRWNGQRQVEYAGPGGLAQRDRQSVQVSLMRRDVINSKLSVTQNSRTKSLRKVGRVGYLRFVEVEVVTRFPPIQKTSKYSLFLSDSVVSPNGGGLKPIRYRKRLRCV